jgi:hypothetical protein
MKIHIGTIWQPWFLLAEILLWNQTRTCARVARWFIFKPKIPILVKYGGPWNCKLLLYFMTIRNILRPIGIIYGLLVYIVCGHLVCLDQEKSGNPGVRVFCLQTEMSKPSKSVRDRIRTSKVTFTSTSFLQTKTNQGCQIYLGTIYQNEGRFVNWP